jgi:16S rRNA (cytosine967-C5)-methyltransferase
MPRSTSTTVTDPRDAAYRHIARQAERMPDLGLFDLHTGSIDARDASLAHAIVEGAIARWLTLDYIISTLSDRQLREQEPRMQSVLLGGSAQLLLMDRVPPHAVIDESVEWAKSNIRPGAGGMVNAILRKVSRAKGGRIESWDHHLDAIPRSDGSGLKLFGLELPQSGLHRVSVACSLSSQLVQRWENQYGDPTIPAMHTLSKAPTVIYVAHAQTPIDHLELGQHESPNHRVFSGKRAELVELLASRSDLWVQDAASSHVVDDLKLDSNPALIVDLCAGQGTKTRQLRAMYPDAQIIAADVDETRLATLKSVFVDDDMVHTMSVDTLMKTELSRADLVLTDVPCSNTGVLARRREARYRPMKKQLARLIPIQREIVHNAYALLKQGGILVYSTCSLESEENEDQAEWIASKHDMSMLAQTRVDPVGKPGGLASEYRDGSFSCVFKK